MCISKTDFEAALLGPLQALSRTGRCARRRVEGEARRGDSMERFGSEAGPWGGLVRLREAVRHKPSAKPYALKALHKGHLIHTNQVKVSKRASKPLPSPTFPLSLPLHVPSFPSEHDQPLTLTLTLTHSPLTLTLTTHTLTTTLYAPIHRNSSKSFGVLILSHLTTCGHLTSLTDPDHLILLRFSPLTTHHSLRQSLKYHTSTVFVP